MKLFKKMKDGGNESTVTGYWLIEYKPLFSVVLLKFEGKSREAFHEHAFSCVSWLLKGKLYENFLDGKGRPIIPSWKPFLTKRQPYHKVDSEETSWVLSFRGPWKDSWGEYLPDENRFRTLTHGRIEI